MSRFTRTKEDFTCAVCGAEVEGDGYTNHCPTCLWSRHVDVMPGDRANTCGGLMKPVGLKSKHGEYVIVHECQKCGAKASIRARKNDSFEEMLKLARIV